MKNEIIKILNECNISFSEKDNKKELISELRKSNRIKWFYISKFQNLSDSFRKEFNLN